MKGSPTCTLGRFAASPPTFSVHGGLPPPVPPGPSPSTAPNVALASTEAPPTPSGPVVDPNRITLLPGPLAAATCRSPCRITPTQSALTSGFPA